MRRELWENKLKEIEGKQLEKKLAINNLSQEETIVRGKSSEAAMLVSELHNKEVLLCNEIDKLEKELSELQNKFNSDIGKDIDFMSQIERSFDLYIKCLEELTEKVSNEEDILSNIKEKEEMSHLKIVKEEKVLSEKQRDFNIYKERLEKKFKELLPDSKLIL